MGVQMGSSPDQVRGLCRGVCVGVQAIRAIDLPRQQPHCATLYRGAAAYQPGAAQVELLALHGIATDDGQLERERAELLAEIEGSV